MGAPRICSGAARLPERLSTGSAAPRRRWPSSERDHDYLRAVVFLAVRARRRWRIAVAAFAVLSTVVVVVSLLAMRAECKAA